ncbi:MAG: glucosamine-6-phosphate isomerase, partial [Clostridia bacterium]
MSGIAHITTENLGKGSPIPLTVFANEQDVYLDIALEMIDQIQADRKVGKPSVLICPVGPVGQYALFTRMVNRYRIPCDNVYIFNMDEYLTEKKQWVPMDHPMSFRGLMQRALYDKLDP